MIAFILAGGLGTRLRPRFGDLPKSLAPLGGRPFLARQLEWLAAHGVRRAVVCAGYDCDPWLLERARWERGALGAVALYRVEDAASRGRVNCGADGRVVRFVEKDASHRGPAWVNGGLYAFAPWLWRRLPAAPTFSLERELLPALAAEGRLAGVTLAGAFYDIGTPEEWERAERRFSA
ncbi:MAG: NTP transferase domain-containing protein [Candidatus Eisenbacteria bacterium]|nr:NTP transferase domain-containing protein [Candidatus Eisenbacteria bacterium]